MKLDSIKKELPKKQYEILKENITEFRPSQKKALEAGLLQEKNLLVCTPTASGKTLIAEMVSVKRVLEGKGKTVYIVPLKALANEKYNQFKERYGKTLRIGLSSGDLDTDDSYLANYDIIITTSEKLDSLIRHDTPWLKYIATIIVDEIHLLNDTSRGPTLEVVLTMLRQMVKAQIIGLSATIGNPEELGEWLNAKVVEDDWRPVELKQGIYFEEKIKFY